MACRPCCGPNTGEGEMREETVQRSQGLIHVFYSRTGVLFFGLTSMGKECPVCLSIPVGSSAYVSPRVKKRR